MKAASCSTETFNYLAQPLVKLFFYSLGTTPNQGTTEKLNPWKISVGEITVGKLAEFQTGFETERVITSVNATHIRHVRSQNQTHR